MSNIIRESPADTRKWANVSLLFPCFIGIKFPRSVGIKLPTLHQQKGTHEEMLPKKIAKRKNKNS